jgi:hypothetical protein
VRNIVFFTAMPRRDEREGEDVNDVLLVHNFRCAVLRYFFKWKYQLSKLVMFRD